MFSHVQISFNNTFSFRFQKYFLFLSVAQQESIFMQKIKINLQNYILLMLIFQYSALETLLPYFLLTLMLLLFYLPSPSYWQQAKTCNQNFILVLKLIFYQMLHMQHDQLHQTLQLLHQHFYNTLVTSRSISLNQQYPKVLYELILLPHFSKRIVQTQHLWLVPTQN